MKKVKLIYNPFAGDRRFKYALDACAEAFYKVGYAMQVLRNSDIAALHAEIANIDDNCEALVAAGGDGTVNLVVNAMKRYQKDIPLGIIPAGTANDIASYLNMPKNAAAAAEAIANGRVVCADLGLVNDRYFINSCGGGLFLNVSHQLTVNNYAKSIFGKLAYYAKGFGQLAHIKPYLLRVTTPKQTYEGEFVLSMVLNSGISGGFKRLSPQARINDGLLDFVGFRSISSMTDFAILFLKVLSGSHLNDRRVLFLQEKSFEIENLGLDSLDTDVDGEPMGIDSTLHITCQKRSLRLIVPAKRQP